MSDFEKRLLTYKRFGSKLGLERITNLLTELGNPEKNLNIIHIAGTNGKGSTALFLYNILLSAGYNTGLFISPWVYTENERIQYNGNYIKGDELEHIGDEVFNIADKLQDTPTEFEILTAASFKFFSDKTADYCIIETGLGGRFDSTNVIKKPVLTIITSISLDHTNELGNTKKKIAFEKAGIIKYQVPLISNAKGFSAKRVIKKVANDNDAKIIVPKKFDVSDIIKKRSLPSYQVENLRTVFEVSKFLNVPKKNIYEGIERTVLPGRFEKIKTIKGTDIVFDGSHNEDGFRTLVKTIKKYYKNSKILIVLGMLKDKNIKKMINILKKVHPDIIATSPNNNRALPYDELSKILNVIYKGEIRDAYDFALSKRKNYDLILVTGSFYTLKDLQISTK